MPNDKLCVGCPYRKSNGWCMLTACANQKRYDISNYVAILTRFKRIMKFLILTFYGSYEIEAEDFEDAVGQAYNNHTGYADIMAIVKMEETSK